MGPVSTLARASILCEAVASIRDNGTCRLHCVLVCELATGLVAEMR